MQWEPPSPLGGGLNTDSVARLAAKIAETAGKFEFYWSLVYVVIPNEYLTLYFPVG